MEGEQRRTGGDGSGLIPAGNILPDSLVIPTGIGLELKKREEIRLFLKKYKEIKRKSEDKTLYTCEKCDAKNLSLEQMKSHVTSVLHRNNHKQKLSAQLEQEWKEMKKKGGGSTATYYLCTPCGFTSDSLLETKTHIQEESHRRRTVNYCHVCSMFSNNREEFKEHRFSTAHCNNMKDLSGGHVLGPWSVGGGRGG